MNAQGCREEDCILCRLVAYDEERIFDFDDVKGDWID